MLGHLSLAIPVNIYDVSLLLSFIALAQHQGLQERLLVIPGSSDEIRRFLNIALRGHGDFIPST